MVVLSVQEFFLKKGKVKSGRYIWWLLPARENEQGNVIGFVRIYICVCVCVQKWKNGLILIFQDITNLYIGDALSCVLDSLS